MARAKTATRTISNAGDRRVIGLFPSLKNSQMVAWESQLERDLLYLLEYRRDIARYACQPRRFDIWVDGGSALYTPDVEAIDTDGVIHYLEVKPSSALTEPRWRARLAGAREAIESADFGFGVFTELDLRPGHRAENLRKLYPYAAVREEDFETVMEAVVALVNHTKLPVSLASLLLSGQSATPPLPAASIYQAVFHQRVLCDLVRGCVVRGDVSVSPFP